MFFNVKYLTKQDIEKFNQVGYLVKKKFFSLEEISKIRTWVYQYMEKKPDDWENGKEMAYYETNVEDGNRILTRLENFVDYNEKFQELVYSEKIKGCIEELLGEPSVLF